tara:strand:+ start:346 stop:546 length:201 start_codon:yes stop_codon:yes gene_type:complete
MGYFKRNRIVYHGVKGERIYSNSMKRKKKRVYLGAESYEKQKIADLAFAVLFLTIGIGFIVALIVF